MVGKPCQSRYVKLLWLEACVFHSHSGLFLLGQQLVPHLDSLSLPRHLFSCECFMDSPTHLNPFKRKELICSFIHWRPIKGYPRAFVTDLPGQDELTPQSSGPPTSLCRITPGEEMLRKEAFISRPLSKPTGLELWGGERSGSQPGALHFSSTHLWCRWSDNHTRKYSRRVCQSPISHPP